MEQLEQISQTIALSLGAAWASGINLYATVLVLGLMGNSGAMPLPESLQIVQHPLVIGASALMYAVEFFADKVPGVDSGWDAIHSFIRIPAGAALAAAATGQVDPAISLAAALIGGSLSAATHATKAGSRILINASPEPFSNWGASLGEDLLVLGGLWTALHHPLLFLALLLLFLVLLLWLLPRIWRGLCLLGRTLRDGFKRGRSGRSLRILPPKQLPQQTKRPSPPES
ncbi:DUF4126 domain-containing protein [Desulfuromonas thiophila]|uniref:DUF4126 domain-containing protein n=1 Tax=Desulfuromonas thiophila TaxID=57664 RepID=A0A1G7BEL7_9BACT|nr:DUF4126 domain-containing protein [Desulfuromonas thiophila]SDE25452.1 protein of unknown function [Desulfuromonas thiophila]